MLASLKLDNIEFELVVGLEVHVQLTTHSKVFSADSASFGLAPNENAGIVSIGLPGTLPRLNKKVIECALKLGIALNSKINQLNTFDRKNYFYPDLPKGYQITQDKKPIILGGYLPIMLENKKEKKIRIHHVHIEEDAGRSIHDLHPNSSLVDLNRAGVALLEIVTEPDIASADEATTFLTEIQKLVRFLEISDGNMEEGSLRCDVNISIRPKHSNVLGTRCEVKNMNSIRNVKRAINFEFERQKKEILAGNVIIQNTLHFNDSTGATSRMRSKEMANDYRYFPEPDLPPVIISDKELLAIKKAMPLTPQALFAIYTNDYKLSDYDAGILTSEKDINDYFTACARLNTNYKAIANWMIGPIKSFVNEHKISFADLKIKPEHLCSLIDLIDSGHLNTNLAAKEILPNLLIGNSSALNKNYALQSTVNHQELQQVINDLLVANQDKVLAYKKGKKGLIGFFIGEIMKKMDSKLDPKIANEMLLIQLEK